MLPQPGSAPQYLSDPCIPLSGWDLYLVELELEAVTVSNDPGSYSPGDRMGQGETQDAPCPHTNVREPRSFPSCLCSDLVGLVRPDGVVGSAPLCHAGRWASCQVRWFRAENNRPAI